MRQESYISTVIIFLLLLISINLLILDLYIFSPNSQIRVSQTRTEKPTPATQISTDDTSTTTSLACPKSCLVQIEELSNKNLRLGGTEELPSPTEITNSSITREYYIPLGSGSTNKNSFENLTATETVIDTANYGKIKQAYFIASLRNPTQNGQVDAQIYNVTDKHPVWGSLVIMNGPSNQTLTSEKITIDQGYKLYRVQLKSSLSYDVYLDNAKIRILAE